MHCTCALPRKENSAVECSATEMMVPGVGIGYHADIREMMRFLVRSRLKVRLLITDPPGGGWRGPGPKKVGRPNFSQGASQPLQGSGGGEVQM